MESGQLTYEKVLVSVNMIAYNAGKYIAESIESIINQTFENWELIIIDDGSVDDTLSIANAYALNDNRIRVYSNGQNEGIVYTRNRAIHYSKGKYIAVLDSDDLALPERMERQVLFLEQNPDYGLVGCSQHLINEKGLITSDCIFSYPQICYPAILSFYNHVPHSSMMTKKALLAEYMYRPLVRGYSPAEDYRFVVEVSEKYKVWNLPDILISYREHGNGISKSKKGKIDEHINLIISEQLAKNGIFFQTEAQFDLHKSILNFSKAENSNELTQKVKWILFLKNRNDKMHAFSKDGYSLYLYIKMVEIIKSNPESKFTILKVWMLTFFYFYHQMKFSEMWFLLKRIRYESFSK